ncbi:T9SS type A sorting domain-containing protein [candidate division KSB1 bacterium]|nr:T9SS type A sorting domain-containing protein [candidate division KSB1 bacterium]
MKKTLPLFVILLLSLHYVRGIDAHAMINRIPYNGQEIFLSGANVAWVNFARDIGPGTTDLNSFAQWFLDVHDHGGNCMRLWLHTDGSSTPFFDASGNVTGPGTDTIDDLRAILDLAWEREVGLILCLWSFDMLETSHDQAILDRNQQLLTDETKLNTYIDNSLIPMVDSLKDHPGVLAWEIFNEPEGMSNEFGWGTTRHVPMQDIQRFINLCAGAIHRTDSTALVSSGCWSPVAITDIENHTNYYRDDRLIAAGGDSSGTLDFYMVHYYTSLGYKISPFSYFALHWGLTKPLVIGEFYTEGTIFGVPRQKLFTTLYDSSYAGGLAWQYNEPFRRTNMLSNMQTMWDLHQDDVDIDGIGGDWPQVSISEPADSATFDVGDTITIVADAYDPDGTITLIEFYQDTTRLGEDSEAPFTVDWPDVQKGKYKLHVIATDDQGHQRKSELIEIVVGVLEITVLDAEDADLTGETSVQQDNTAHRGKYVYMQNTGTITWTIPNVTATAEYPVKIGYRIPFDHKTQFLYVNGVQQSDVVFDGALNTWLEKIVTVPLNEGENTLMLEKSWGWMHFDYIEVPFLIATSVADANQRRTPGSFTISANYPNPFNPSTTIRYEMASAGQMEISVFDIQGREIKTLLNEARQPGSYAIAWDGSDALGRSVSSGTYFIRFKSENEQKLQKVVLLK